VVVVRLLLFLALAAIGVSLVLYLVKRDRRYLRFIGQVFVFTLIVLAAVLLLFGAERLLGPILAPMF
jgi:energy-converting hydrogenase Eha subunit E